MGISKITFASYYDLPGIINDRLFSVLDLNKNGYLETSEFILGMSTLFCGDFDSNAQFIFNFYDFDKDGKISKEDIRTVLSYVSLSQEIKNYQDRVKSQEELYEIIEKCFSLIKGETMKYEDFKSSIENVSSDIYLMILLFLYEKRPFTKTTLSNYSKTKKSLPNSPEKEIASPKSPSKLLASPTKTAGFSPYQIFNRPSRKRKATITQDISELNKKILHNSIKRSSNKRHTIQTSNDQDIIKLMPMISQQNKNPTKVTSKFKKESIPSPMKTEYQNTVTSPIIRKEKKNLKELGKAGAQHNYLNKFTEVKIEPAFKQGKNSKKTNTGESESGSVISGTKDDKNNEDNLLFDSDDDDEKSEEEEENVVKNEGYLYKYVNNKLKKVWFRLVHKDLFYFKNEKDEIHKGMHNLSGVFLQEEPVKELGGKKYFSFSIQYPKKTRYYYIEKEEDYKQWIEKLKIATGYTNLTDIYEISSKIGNGKFGLIKVGINKKTGQKVAIKILCKKDMTNQDLELMRTEIEILKICQHPNIIQLYDVFENTDYFYIIIEYCKGRDLFSYLEKRRFRLQEDQACRIMHKMCAAVYYIHSYGIAHRDLKPENVLMTSDDDDADIRILDFGLSKIIGPEEKCTEPFGTLSYVAPEVLLDEPYGKEVDLWSLGIITYLMLSGSLPFDHKTDEEEIARKTVSEPPPYKGSIWARISKEARNFIDNLLQKDPSKRMNIKEALEHEWFNKFSNSKIICARKQSKDIKSSAFELYSTVDEKSLK